MYDPLVFILILINIVLTILALFTSARNEKFLLLLSGSNPSNACQCRNSKQNRSNDF